MKLVDYNKISSAAIQFVSDIFTAIDSSYGIVKAYLDVFKTMKLSTLANFSLAITNGSHQPAGTIGKTMKTKQRVPKPAGIAVTSPDTLKYAITKLCGTRRRKTGAVTILLREKCAHDTVLADDRRKARMKAELEKKARAHLKKGITFNNVHPDPNPLLSYQHSTLPYRNKNCNSLPASRSLFHTCRTWRSLWRILCKTWKTS